MEKPEYFRLHEEEDRAHFKKLQTAIDKLPCREDLDESIAKSIEVHVNGKIREVHNALSVYIEKDEKWKREEAMPAIQGYNKGISFFSILASIPQYLLPFLGLIGVIYGFLTWIKN